MAYNSEQDKMEIIQIKLVKIAIGTSDTSDLCSGE
jgi:hypothetical protein